MASALADTIRKLLESIRSLFGNPDPKARLRNDIKAWQTAKLALRDEVEELKEQLRCVEDGVRAKHRELEQTRGASRSIVEEEIKSLFTELDARKRKQDVIFGGIDRLNKLVAQAEQFLAGATGTVDPDRIRELQLQGADVLSALKETDRETARAAAMQYQRPTGVPANYEARKAEVVGAEPVAQATVAGPQAAQPASTLSDTERQRLAQIIKDAE